MKFSQMREKGVPCPLSRKSKGQGNGMTWAIVCNGDCCNLVATYETVANCREIGLEKRMEQDGDGLGCSVSLDLTC